MTKSITISVETRERSGKGAARETRRKGLIPGVIYGDKRPPVIIAIRPQILWAEMNRAGFYTHMYSVQLGDKVEMCLVRDVQKHPVSDKPIHVDFLRVDPNAKIHVRVPVHFINQEKSIGLKKGGMLNVALHEIELVASAGSIPSALIVDIGNMDIGAAVHVSSLALPEGVSLAAHNDADATVAIIAAPNVQTDADATDAEGAAEPAAKA